MKHQNLSRLLFGSLFCLATTLVAFAQTAQLTGRVSDQSGAVIPDTRVTVTNTGTGIKREATTNGDGYYTVPLLQPGTYQIALQKDGFKTLTQPGIVLQVEQTARLDFTLLTGTVTEAVTVTSEATLTAPETSSLGQVIDEQRVRELPLNGRNPVELARLSAGVTLLGTAFRDIGGFNVTSMSINGGQGGTNAILLDGGNATVPERNEFVAVPNVDGVQEFKVQTNSFSAEFGLTGGGVINIVTRSGTNDFRGNVYEFLRNDAIDANSWTNNRLRLKKGALRYNQFGANFGGPLPWPRFGTGGPALTSGRNRAFFFFNYEGYRYRTSANTIFSRVPTELERRGDFSQTYLLDPTTRQPVRVRLFDPATTRNNPSGTGQVRDPFPTAVLPTSRLDPAALKTLALVPLPNRAPDDLLGTNNYVSTPSVQTDNDQYNGRLDVNLGAANKLFGRFTQSENISTGGTPAFAFDNVLDPNASFQKRLNRNLVIGDTHVFGGSLINEFRFSYVRQITRSVVPGTGQNVPALLGLGWGLPDFVFPRFEIGNITALGNNTSQFSSRAASTGQIYDAVSLTRGKHFLKAGVDLRVSLQNRFFPAGASGIYNFGTGLTGNPQTPTVATGFGVATFLLGQVSGGNLTVDISRADSFRIYSGFVNDDYKILPRLTLNLGLRHDVITPYRERYNRYSNFNLTATNPITGLPGVLQFTRDFGRQVAATDYDNVGPRIGFAFDVFGNGRTVVRGGYGIFYYHGAILEIPAVQGSTATTNFASTLGANYPSFTLSQGPPAIAQPNPAALGPASFLGNAVNVFEPKTQTPSVQQWNLNLQQALPGKWLLDVAYAGNHGTHIIGPPVNVNALDPQYLSLGLALQDRVANPLFGKIPAGTPLSAATITRQQSLLPYPAYLGVSALFPHYGNTVYHSGQLKLERRFGRNGTVLAAYTFAKLIGDAGYSVINFDAGGAIQGAVGCGSYQLYNRRACRSIEPQDITHNLIVSYVYELPFGRGQHWLSNGVAAQVLGGWQLNGIVAARSGLPLLVRGANNGAADRPNLVGSAKLDNPTPERWFNTAAFVNPPQFTLGNTPRTLPDVRGPGFYSVDFSLARNFIFTERLRLQFRAEAFNFFNRVNLGQPDVGALSGTFGRINTAGEPRRMQFGLKLYF